MVIIFNIAEKKVHKISILGVLGPQNLFLKSQILRFFKYISGKIRSRNLSNTFMEAYLGVCNFHQKKKIEILIFGGCGPQNTITPKCVF